MTREEIIEKTIETLTDEFDVTEEEIVEDAPIYQTLHLDSLSLVDLVAVVQYTFKVKIPAEPHGLIQLHDRYQESHTSALANHYG